MRSGFDVTPGEAVDVDFLRKVASIMKVLLQQSIATAHRFAQACGRRVITARDTRLALQYEAHEFCKRESLDADFLAAYEEEQQHTYATDDSSEGDTSGDSSGDDDSPGGEDSASNGSGSADHGDTRGCVDDDVESTEFLQGDDGERAFHAQVLKYAAEWDDWYPEDQVQALIKRGVDKIEV